MPQFSVKSTIFFWIFFFVKCVFGKKYLCKKRRITCSYCSLDISRKNVFFFFFFLFCFFFFFFFFFFLYFFFFFFFFFFFLFVCLAFYFKWNYFVVIDHILSETICPFCFCVLFSKSYSKIKFTAKNWSNLCNFYFKVIYKKKLSKKIFFYFSFLNFKYWCYATLWKIRKKMNKRNLLKICRQVTYPTDFCIICIHVYYGKKWR